MSVNELIRELACEAGYEREITERCLRYAQTMCCPAVSDPLMSRELSREEEMEVREAFWVAREGSGGVTERLMGLN
jgi:hypothetical protein